MGSLPFNSFLVFAFPFFLLVLHLPLLSATAVLRFSDYTHCARQQLCGNLNISYPFFNGSSWWLCHGGFELIRSLNGSTPVLIHTGEENDESTYQVQSIDYTTKIMLAHDRRFTRDWHGDNETCNALFNDYTMPPIFRYLSAQLISPNLRLRVCKRRHPQPNDDSHGGVQYGKDCNVEAIPDDATPPGRPSSHRSLYDCKLVHLPVELPHSTFRYGVVHHVSQFLSVGFRVRWNLPPLCHQCETNGTICWVWNNNNQDYVLCKKPNGERNHEKG